MKKKKKVKVLLWLGAVLVILVAIELILFRVASVEIEGTDRYKPEEMKSYIVKAPWDNNSLFLMLTTLKGKDFNIPYIDNVRVKLLSPGKIKVIAQEKVILFQEKTENGFLDLDARGQVQGETDKRNGSVLLLMNESKNPGYPNVPELLTDHRLDIVKTVAEFLLKNPELPFRQLEIDQDRYVLSNDAIQIRFGQGKDISEKLKTLRAMYPEIRELSGVLHLEEYHGDDQGYRFEKTEEPETENSTQTGTPGQVRRFVPQPQSAW